MLERLQRFLAAPVFPEDEEKTRIAFLLNPILITLLGVMFLAFLALFFIFPEPIPSAIAILLTCGLLLIVRFLMVRGHVRNACRLLIGGLGLDIFFLVIFGGGITGVNTTFYIALVIVTSLLLGSLATILLIISIVCTGIGMIILESTHALPPQIFSMPPRSGLVILIFASILVAFTLYMALHNLEEARNRYKQELAERKTIQAALTESEQRFHAIFDSVNDAIFVHDLKTGAILDVNQRMCEMYGYTRQEALQLSIEEMSQGEPPYSQRDALGWFHRIPLGGSHLAEWYAKGKNGHLFWVEINLRHTMIAGQERMLVTVRDINERKKADQRRAALYRISDAARAAQDMDDFYHLLHAVICTLMPAKNFFIALYDPSTDLLSYPYYSDEYDQPPPPHQIGKGLTAYVIRTDESLLATPEVFQQLVAEGSVENVGTPCVDWLGAPLRTTHGVIGVLAVQTYTESERLTLDDQEVLVFVSNQVAMMLARKRAEEHDRMFSQGLRAVIEAADELIRCDQMDTLYRRAVELAREKIGVERVGLFILEPGDQYLVGTYGTDDQGRTTDEHAAIDIVQLHPYPFTNADQPWYVRQENQSYWDDDKLHLIDVGWVAGTVIRSLERPIGVMFNDTAISHTPLSEATQETLAVYCSLLGNIIERKRLEERQLVMANKLHAVVDCADELLHCDQLDTLYRRAVELARERLGVERIGLFLLDPEGKTLVGTYGTDDQSQTTEEHDATEPASSHPYLFNPTDQLWHVRTITQAYWEGGKPHELKTGWVAGTVIRSVTQPIGILFNDCAISQSTLNETIQETLAVYSSLLGNIIVRKRLEERQREMVHRLHAVVDATDELIGCENLDTFYRRAVELAREKLNVERCSIYLLEENREFLVGTYGTNDQGQTTDEHFVQIQNIHVPEIYDRGVQKYVIYENSDQIYYKNGDIHSLNQGWVASTIIRIADEPIGVFYNDTAISHTPPNETIQETVAIYCSLLGNIIKRKRAEERERDMVHRLHAMVDATDELIGCDNLDMFYRRAIELAREKLNVERCSIFLLDEAHEKMLGTYGTNDQGQTTDEHLDQFPAINAPEIFDRNVQKYTVHDNVTPIYWKNGEKIPIGQGWVASTIIRIGEEPIGVFYNDTAISHAPPNETVQETISIYCSLLGNIIKRMHVETEQKRLIAELEAKNSELERFAYTVSHDLKSPLITIRGFLGFLEKDAASGNIERFKTDIGRISEATNKMQQLLNGLLELSRVGRLMNPAQLISFEEITRDAIALVQGQIDAIGAEVILHKGLPFVFGDRARLVEVVQNLLDNAVKFSSHQVNPRIEIGAREPDETGKPIFFVRDNGLGIDPQYHERIFGLFNKLDSQSEGTGIGLALVKRIIEFHNGRIWVESEGRGKGSTFYFTLPITDPQEPG
jgi:PAS domain S-box-containing protein